MLSLPHSPEALTGKKVVLPCGTAAAIGRTFNLASGLRGIDDAWVAEIYIPLRERECVYDPIQGISLTGKRWIPISELGRSVWIID